MIAIGNYIIIKDVAENIKKTAGGLELTEKHEEVRYRKGIVILPSNEVTSMVGMEDVWKITTVSDVSKPKTKKSKKKGGKMNLQTFHQNY